MAKKKGIPALNLTLLATVAAATLAGNFIYVSAADAAPFLTHTPPLMEQNPTMTQDGNLATRTTPDGSAYSQLNPAQAAAAPGSPAPAPTADTGSDEYPIIDVGTLPAIKRGGGNTAGSSKYQFDKLEVGKGFFVPATTDKPNPAKGLASTVSAATRKYAVPVFAADGVTPEKEQYKGKNGAMLTRNKTRVVRKFELRKVNDGTPYGHPGVSGALIGRTQ